MPTVFLQFDSIADQAIGTFNVLIFGCQFLAGIFGFVGALRIFNKWQLNGHHLHIDKELAGWFGASLFFLLVDQFISLILL